MSISLLQSLGAFGYLEAMSAGDEVNYIHPELLMMIPKYKKIKDCLNGEDAIKLGKEMYLPKLPYSEDNKENEARYDNYLKRAVFYPVLQQTSLGLVGQCFLNTPVCDVPDLIKPLIENVDGSSDINLFASECLSTNVNFSRGAIFTDMMISSGESSLRDEAERMPFFVKYEPDNIINWKYRIVNGRKVLSLIVLREYFDTEKSSYSIDLGVRYRVLRLDREGFYNVEVFVLEEKDGKSEFVHDIVDGREIGIIYPKVDGLKMNYIPIEPIVSQKYTFDTICTPHMYNLANMNIGHFRNSADYEESCFMNGQGTLLLTGITKKWYEDTLKNKIRLGALGVIPLEKGSDGKILQLNPNSMPIEAMRHKESQMLSLGAKIFQPSNIVRTATESSMDKSDESSILTTTASNTSLAITNSIKTAYYMKTGDNKSEKYNSIKFKILTESSVSNLTPQEQLQLVANWQAGAITDGEMRSKFKQAGIAFDNNWKPPAIEVQPVSSASPKKKLKSSGTVNTVTGNDLKGNRNNN